MCIKTIDKTLYIYIYNIYVHIYVCFPFQKMFPITKKKNKFVAAYINQLPNTNLSQKKILIF